MEELEVGNDHVNRAVGKGAPLLDPVQEIPHDLPGSVGRGNGEGVQVGKVRLDVGGIRADGVIRQVPFVKHLKKDSKIIQGKILLKSNDSGSKQTAR